MRSIGELGEGVPSDNQPIFWLVIVVTALCSAFVTYKLLCHADMDFVNVRWRIARIGC
jgi:hypothetical protein